MKFDIGKDFWIFGITILVFLISYNRFEETGNFVMIQPARDIQACQNCDQASCTDSDGGIVPEYAGCCRTVQPYNDFQRLREAYIASSCPTDFCLDDSTLRESFCNGDGCTYITIYCVSGSCIDGACTPLNCTDNDGDGFFGFDPVYCPEGDDCDDLNSSIYPGAPELCDGVDNNCDSIIDEGCVDCGYVISEDNSTFVLNKDLLNCLFFGIMIDAKGVTLDCNGHHITGAIDGLVYNSSGVENCGLSSFDYKVGPSGVVVCRNEGGNYHIKNCIIHEGFSGLMYGGAITIYSENQYHERGLIENNHVYNVGRGMLHWGDFDTIRNNVFDNCSKQGIWLDESAGSLVYNNSFLNSWTGIYHYCGGACNNKQYPTNMTDNYLENNHNGMWFWTVGTAYIRDNIIGNTFITYDETQTPVGYSGDVILYYENNTHNGEPYP